MIITLIKDENLCVQMILLRQASFLGQIFNLVIVIVTASDISIFGVGELL